MRLNKLIGNNLDQKRRIWLRWKRKIYSRLLYFWAITIEMEESEVKCSKILILSHSWIVNRENNIEMLHKVTILLIQFPCPDFITIVLSQMYKTITHKMVLDPTSMEMTVICMIEMFYREESTIGFLWNLMNSFQYRGTQALKINLIWIRICHKEIWIYMQVAIRMEVFLINMLKAYTDQEMSNQDKSMFLYPQLTIMVVFLIDKSVNRPSQG